MVITRRWAVFLTGVGVWTWVIWPRFALAIWKDDRAFAGGTPTAFLWVHAVLIAASLAIGSVVGVLGARAWWASRKPAPQPTVAPGAAEEFAAATPSAPQD